MAISSRLNIVSRTSYFTAVFILVLSSSFHQTFGLLPNGKRYSILLNRGKQGRTLQLSSSWGVEKSTTGSRFRTPSSLSQKVKTSLSGLRRRPNTSPSSTALFIAAHANRKILEGKGMPSNPGWRSGKLDLLTEWAGSKAANRPIICEYEPDGGWLWRRWNGTILKMTKSSVIICMVIGIILDIVARSQSPIPYSLLQVPPSDVPFFQFLGGVKKLWEYQLTLATFILTFFLSHSYAYWQKVYDTCRKIQGRINDICMLLSIGTKRSTSMPTPNVVGGTESILANGLSLQNNDDESQFHRKANEYDDKAREIFKRCTRLIRLSHTFFWAATPTASNGINDSEKISKEGDGTENDTLSSQILMDDEHIGPLLLSPYGLRALVDSGQLTEDEMEDLLDSNLPPSQYTYVLLVWVGLHIMEGMEKGHIRGGPGLEENLLRQMTTLRATMFDIDDFRAGRMPLAYVQLVQVMVDSLVVLSPFALYVELGSLSIPLVGLMAIFFRGLLSLSKSFLDPFGVEGFEEQNIRVDVLVSELNFGAARRWINAARRLPKGFTRKPEKAATSS